MNAARLDKKNERWIQIVPVKEYYTVQECSLIMDVGPPSVYSAIKRGTMKGVRINGVTHVSHDALIDYINRRGTGGGSGDISDAVIEEIKPEAESHKQAVELAEDVEQERAEVDVDSKSDPLDFLEE